MNDLAIMAWESDAQFVALSDESRKKVRDRIRVIERVLKHEGRRGDIIAQEANRLGVGGSTLRGWVSAYENSGGDWRTQVDWRCEGHEEQALPKDMQDFIQVLCGQNKRSNRRAFKKMVELYRSGATTYQQDKDSAVFELWPGYIDDNGHHYRPEPLPATGLPAGWSLRNFYRYAPKKLEATLNRQGPIAASEYMAMVYTTRKDYKAGQFYVFDDRWCDIESVVDNMVKPVRSIELSAGDLFTGKTASWDLFPLEETLDENGEAKREQIKGIHMKLLLADLLCVKGFHKDGVTLIVELGTAAITHEMEMLLCRLSGGMTDFVTENGKRVEKIIKPGLIKVSRSGTKGGRDFGGGYPTLSKGNFRSKASWESTHNLKHNMMADVPGQTGKDSKKEPMEELHGRRAETIRWLTIATEKRPEFRKAILENIGFLSSRQLHWTFDRYLQAMEADPDHHIEGWEEANLMQLEYRLDETKDGWRPMSDLERFPEGQRTAINAFLSETSWTTRKRRMSRQEAWLAGQGELTRLPLHCVPQILGEDMAKYRPDLCKDRVVTDENYIDVNIDAIGNDRLIFSSICRRINGVEFPLTPGTIYRTWISPLMVKTLFVADIDGRYIGTCKFERVSRGDDEAVKREMGRAAHDNALLTREPLRRARLNNRRRKAQLQRANEIFAGGPVTDEERQLQAERDERRRKAPGLSAFIPQTAIPEENEE